MRALRIVLILVVAYIGIIVLFESLIGVFQPASDQTLVIVTTDSSGQAEERVLARLESGGTLYVAANHWPREWYREALANPEVQIIQDGETQPYTAVPVEAAEHDRINSENDTGVVFKILTGFPPRRFLRLEPS